MTKCPLYKPKPVQFSCKTVYLIEEIFDNNVKIFAFFSLIGGQRWSSSHLCIHNIFSPACAISYIQLWICSRKSRYSCFVCFFFNFPWSVCFHFSFLSHGIVYLGTLCCCDIKVTVSAITNYHLQLEVRFFLVRTWFHLSLTVWLLYKSH